MKKFHFKYGSGAVDFELDEKNILGELSGNSTPACEDIAKAVYGALKNPIESAKPEELVQAGDKITFVVSDMSRFWMRQDLVIPHVVEYFHEECGISYANMTILVANGTHTPGTEEDLKTIVTPEIYQKIRVVNHDCLQKDALTEVGTTPHGTKVIVNKLAVGTKLTVCIGAATHHVMAGYGGGRKSILPGISSMETICHNHAFALDPRELRSNPLIGNGVLEGNPLNEDMCEAAALLPNLFMVNLVMNEKMQLSSVFAGHWKASWLKACKEADRIYSIPVPEKADVVIASCGGFPKDMSLYQGTKTIDNIESCLKIGGTLILFIEARDGGGPAEYFDWIKDWTGGTMNRRIREHFTVPGYIFLLNCEQAQRYRVMMLTSIPREIVKPMGIEAYSDIGELLKNADLEGKSVYVIENGSTVIPRAQH